MTGTRRQLLGSAALLAGPLRAAPLEVVYPNLAERPAEAYGFQLLRLALQRSGLPHRLRLAEAPVSAQRALLQLERGELQVVDTGSSEAGAARFDMLPFPLDLGLSGCRLLLGRRETLQRLQAVRSLADLRSWVFGQGLGWIDTRILRAAGLRVEEGQFVSLLRMLQAGRFDLYPLGAEEAHRMLERHRSQAPDVGIHDGLALYYPFARVFYLAPGQAALREALLSGLQAALADGTLLELLRRDPGLGPILRGQRPLPPRLLALPNPWLPAVLRALPSERLHPAIQTSWRAAHD